MPAYCFGRHPSTYIYFLLSAAENVCPLLVNIATKAVYIPKSGPPRDMFDVERASEYQVTNLDNKMFSVAAYSVLFRVYLGHVNYLLEKTHKCHDPPTHTGDTWVRCRHPR